MRFPAVTRRRPLASRARLALYGLLAGAHLAAWAGPGERTALVIGNADYPRTPLRNPVNDATAMRASLDRLGFAVDLRTDASRAEMIEALRTFFRAAARSEVRLVYFAGHGVQWHGHNYLVPADADVRSTADFASAAIDLNEIVERLGSLRHGVNIVVVDACRNNPFAASTTQLADARRMRTRSLTAPPTAEDGLAPVTAPAGTLIAFSTAPGSVSVDSPGEPNSVYTRQLVQRLATPGLPVEKLFKEVRAAVATRTQFQQVPWESSSLIGEFCFRPTPSGACSP